MGCGRVAVAEGAWATWEVGRREGWPKEEREGSREPMLRP